jgi:glycosyltransferase involved in cell wall biosynthesis
VTIVHLVIGGEVAGGQMVALALLRGARARGDRVLVVSPTPGPFVDLVRTEGVQVEFLDLSRTFRVADAWRLAGLLRREDADVLHTHTALAANALSRLAGRLAGVPVVSHMHIENHFRPQRLPRELHRSLDNATARLCARILVVSDGTRRALERQGIPPRLMETVPNGIEAQPASAAGGLRAELGLPGSAPLVGEVGRLCEVKGQRELIEAVALLAPARPDLGLVLVGRDLEQGGEYERLLRRHAERLGIADSVLFAGYREDVAAVLAELDVVCLPSWIEGLPLVALEAMAQSRPLVATPVGGTGEAVVDGETGLLVPPRDPPRLARAIESLLADPALARRMGQAGRRRLEERFSEQAMVSRVLEVYDEVARRAA